MGYKKFVTLALLLAALTAGILASPVPVASQGGRGVIREGGPTDVATLNPLRCASMACWRVAGFLYPSLLGVDLDRGTFTPAGLATGWDIAPDGLTYTFHLRDDMAWSDGAPVTAYDVYYTYRAIASGEIGSPYTADTNAIIARAEPLDAHTLAFTLNEPTCGALDALVFPVIPAHVFEPGFAGQLADSYSFAFMRTQPFTPSVTAGVFKLESFQPADHLRLATADGALAYELVEMPAWYAWEQFLAGAINYTEWIAWENLADLRTMDDIQVFEFPGLTWDAIRFNLADPRHPQDAFDKNGTRIDQGYHPIFGDERVRRAIQMALDVEALIQAAVRGSGMPIPANQVPASWAYNADLAPAPYDPIGARRLLHEAGWRDSRRDGIRECVGCLYADEGTPLAFELAYDESAGERHTILATMIQEQLGRVGIQVNVRVLYADESSSTVRAQRYDAYLAAVSESYPVNPDQTGLFTSAGDVVGEGANTGSYYNPQVDALMAQARALPGCDVTVRADLYRQIQAILYQDQPYAWLFATNDIFAARGSVTGFAPYPFAPFWNVDEWVIEGE